MTEEPAQPVEVEVLDPKVEKRIIDLVYNVTREIVKKDFRATVKVDQTPNVLDDTEAALIHIDYDKKDIQGNPIDLDVKGTINVYDAERFKEIRFGMMLKNMIDWNHIKVPEWDKDKKEMIMVKVPVDLAQVLMNSKQMLNLSLDGSQSKKHIQERRANSGRDPDYDPFAKLGKMFGGSQKVDKQQIREQYEQR